MTLQPCIECGELSPNNRCSAHRIIRPRAAKSNTDHVAFKNDVRWKKLSKKLRKLSPFCELCGSSDDLTVDHRVRAVDRPEWSYEIDNCRILCRRHNGMLSMVSATPEEEREIEQKIFERRQRRLRLRRQVNEGPS